MRKQTSVLITTVVALGMLFTTVSAEVRKGQNTYLKKCKRCHSNGTKGSALKTQSEWLDLFANDGKEIIKVHMSSEVDANGQKYFKSERFKKKAPHLKDFLWQYGSDSGNVPSCG